MKRENSLKNFGLSPKKNERIDRGENRNTAYIQDWGALCGGRATRCNDKRKCESNPCKQLPWIKKT